MDSKDWITAWQVELQWLWQYFIAPSFLLQIGVATFGLILAFYVGVHFSKWVAYALPSSTKEHWVRRTVLRIARRQAFPLTLLGWISLSILIFEITSSPHAVLNQISSLALAWVLVRLFSAFIGNPTLSHSLANFIWVIAALHILGVLPKTVAWMDSIHLGSASLSLYDLLSSLFAVAMFLWLALGVANLIERQLQHNPDLSAATQALIVKIVRALLLTLACLGGMNLVGVDLTAFAVFGGAVGVGIGLGLQKVFSNLIAGFILLLDKSIKPGDTIVVSGRYGRVNRLNARYVSMLTRNGTEHLIPNDELINNQVENWSYSNTRVRLKIPIGIHYDSDIKHVMELCLAAAAETPRVLKSPAPVCLLKHFGDSALELEQRIWIQDPMNGCSNVKSEVLVRIWEKFRSNNIEIPYPQQDVYLHAVNSRE